MNGTGQASRPTAQSDAATIIGILAVGAVGVIVALVILANIMASLPPMFSAVITFSLVVFAIACMTALLRRKETVPREARPPVLTFKKRRGRLV